MYSTPRRRIATAIAAALLGTPLPVLADTGLEEILVTARKRSENLQQVPVSVTG